MKHAPVPAAPAKRRARAVGALLCAAGLLSAGAAPPEAAASRDSAIERAVSFNLAVADLAAPAALDSLLAAQQQLPAGERVGRWARRYLAAPGTEYRFGPAPGGYVERGLLVPGLRHDCISLIYRTTELARARSARHAIELAVALRFAGVEPDSVVDAQGKVDYDRPEHLDYALDMIRSGLWGEDITSRLAGAVLDTLGSSRYPPGCFHYLPAEFLAGAAAAPGAAATAPGAMGLQEGDLVWFVLDPGNPAARKLRDDHGLVIGHAGILILEPHDTGDVWLVHAASRPLPPWYHRAGVVSVPLPQYLQRVERYRGVVVTRLCDR
ncbi:MAG: hypothetical protein RBT60_05275 [Candidatus Krumholzibacteria bacterium]|nr:hypothetical protein [Candidatus Krumholzibacteria bacterium]